MTALEGKNYYEILGLPKTATTEEIKLSYREIAQVYHPDSNFYSEIVGDGMEAAPQSQSLTPEQEATFKLITAAYTTLSNPERRGRYDQTLAPDLRGWTETDLRVPRDQWNLSSQDETPNVPHAWGTFGKVEENPRSTFDLPDHESRPMSEMFYSKKHSWFTRLCWFFGL